MSLESEVRKEDRQQTQLQAPYGHQFIQSPQQYYEGTTVAIFKMRKLEHREAPKVTEAVINKPGSHFSSALAPSPTS